MIQRLLLTPALAIAALSAASSVAASTAVEPEGRPPHAKFALGTNDGLRGFVEAANGKVTLELNRKNYEVTYEVRAEITDTGPRAQFGKLGLIDVVFEPTKTFRTDKPPKGCEGEPSTHRAGLFVGTIEFTGEREFVHVETTQAKGRMSVYRESEWKCPHRAPSTHDQEPPPPTGVSARARSKAQKRLTALFASSHPCRCYFSVFAEYDREGRGPTYFFGTKVERREEMEIARVTYAGAPDSSFVFDHESGIATVRPPKPFSGHATFERRRHGRDLWRSTIQVPILGTDPLSIRGRDFRVRLVRNLPDD
jgi:hypothetical protein